MNEVTAARALDAELPPDPDDDDDVDYPEPDEVAFDPPPATEGDDTIHQAGA